jgi:XTP/dITP diphosphohydrolase
MTTLLIATRNAHKVVEIQSILGDRFQCCPLLKDFPSAPVPVEDADTFAGNAAKKAVSLATWLASSGAAPRMKAAGAFILADDSGLEVDALGGAPGVHSARFSAIDSTGHAGNSPDADNNAKVLRLLADVPQAKRTARFRCVLALVEVNRAVPLRSPQVFEGACEGRIDFAPRGGGGFGYDPLFIPLGQEKSFAELGESVKNGLSHRAKALASLREWFNQPAPHQRL